MKRTRDELAVDLGLYDSEWWSTPEGAANSSPKLISALTDIAILLTEARQEVEDAEVYHRHVLTTQRDIALSGGGGNRTSEWKVRAKVESTPECLASRNNITILKTAVLKLEGLQMALQEKAKLLAAIIRMQR